MAQVRVPRGLEGAGITLIIAGHHGAGLHGFQRDDPGELRSEHVPASWTSFVGVGVGAAIAAAPGRAHGHRRRHHRQLRRGHDLDQRRQQGARRARAAGRCCPPSRTRASSSPRPAAGAAPAGCARCAVDGGRRRVRCPPNCPGSRGGRAKANVRLSCQVKVKRRPARSCIPEELFSVQQYRDRRWPRIRDLTYDIKEVRLKLAGARRRSSSWPGSSSSSRCRPTS